jgi:hypothetical protein
VGGRYSLQSPTQIALSSSRNFVGAFVLLAWVRLALAKTSDSLRFGLPFLTLPWPPFPTDRNNQPFYKSTSLCFLGSSTRENAFALALALALIPSSHPFVPWGSCKCSPRSLQRVQNPPRAHLSHCLLCTSTLRSHLGSMLLPAPLAT